MATDGAGRGRVLVCDVGGGTTDLTLVAVCEESCSLVLERKAVGDHILLGGDNMDLALAHAVRARLAEAGTTLDEWQLRGLVHACRDAKEKLLAAGGPTQAPVVVLGRSRRSWGAVRPGDATRWTRRSSTGSSVVARDDRPRTARRVGLQEIGLVRQRSAVTRHVAAFNGRHRDIAPDGPDAVLFNGGVMRADRFRTHGGRARRVAWHGRRDRVLAGADRSGLPRGGAATYGLTAAAASASAGGTARAYYVGVETAAPAVPNGPREGLCGAVRHGRGQRGRRRTRSSA
jgi:hypothetical protein